jgi:5'-nucleotidase
LPAVALAGLALAGLAGTAAAEPKRPPITDKSKVEVQILAVNDFHGNLDPPGGSSGRVGNVEAAGAVNLATYVKNLEKTNRNTVVVSAGDLIGASPLISALFHDEPTIEVMNSIGLDINAVGNHEFDEGTAELLRMQNGGCHPVDGCQDGDRFAGADFDFLAANVVSQQTGKTLFPPYKIENFTGARVAFIGMTLEGTPNIVTPSGVAGFNFLDEADTVNALIPELRRRRVEAIVVLIHEGGLPSSLNVNGCSGVSGPIVDIVNRLDPAVDMVISGHTHQPYNCVINNIPVSSAYSFGRVLTDVDMVVDRSTGHVTSVSVNNVIVARDVVDDPAVGAIIERYRALSAPLANRVIGTITSDISRANNPAGESALGDVIADAQLAATAPAGFGEAVVAFMNPGGIRADLTYPPSGSEQPGEVTYGESFTVQPFGNSLVTMTLTGAQIETLLEQQFLLDDRILQVSNGFTYEWSASAAEGDKVDPGTIKINGVTVDPNGSYRVTVNSFLADGGDRFPVLVAGTNRLGGAVDTDALEAYFVANSPVAPGPQNRIIVVS